MEFLTRTIEFIEQHWTILLFAGTAVLGFFGYIFRHRKHYYTRFKNFYTNLIEMVDDTDRKTNDNLSVELAKVSEFMHKELKPNGGTSFRDSVDQARELLLQNIENVNEIRVKIYKIYADHQFLLRIDKRAIFQLDINKNLIFTNVRFEQIVGKSFEQIKNKRWWSDIHPDDIDKVRRRWDLAYENEANFISTHRVIHRDKQVTVTVDMNAEPVYLNKVFSGFIGTFQVVSDRKMGKHTGSLNDEKQDNIHSTNVD